MNNSRFDFRNFPGDGCPNGCCWSLYVNGERLARLSEISLGANQWRVVEYLRPFPRATDKFYPTKEKLATYLVNTYREKE
jgi:sulfur relay (sulfurtransferase) DsrC/TusE family protein